MKRKVFFLVLAAFAALAIIACDNVAEPPKAEDGGITLSVAPTNGRALTGPLAEAGSNFYEATFDNGTNVIRTTWLSGRKGQIKLDPDVTYTVIIMAGRNADKTLLGVGYASAVNGTSATSATPASLGIKIKADTTEITFTLLPLVNNINGKADSTTTFTTTKSDGTVTTSSILDEFDNVVPVFEIDYTSDTAKWTFDIGTNNIGDFGPSIKTIAAGTKVFAYGYSAPDELYVPGLVTASITPPAVITTGLFTINLTTPASGDGITLLSFEVPVVAIDDTPATNPVTWYIRGGLNNGYIDAGSTPSNEAAGGSPGKIGGAVVLGFGNLSAFSGVKVKLDPGW